MFCSFYQIIWYKACKKKTELNLYRTKFTIYYHFMLKFCLKLEEAEKRHEIMVNIMKKEIEHGQRMVRIN